MPSPSGTAPESSSPRLPERAANQQPLPPISGGYMRYLPLRAQLHRLPRDVV